MIRFLAALIILIPQTILAETPQRVVSIGGALTEIVYALDAGDVLVGSDTTSYYPEAAATLPKVGYQRTLSAEGVLSLSPDLVIHSEEAGPPKVLKQLEATGVALLRVDAGRSIDDIKANVRAIGAALDRDAAARRVVADLAASAAKLQKATAGRAGRKRVMFILQHTGGAPMVAGRETAADSVIVLAGAENAVTGYTGYKPLSPEAAVAIAPDIILVTTQGLQQSGGADGVLDMPGVSLTPAAKNKRIISMDALYLLGFGPRTADAAMELHRQIRRP